MTIQPDVKIMKNQTETAELGLLKFITCGSVDDGKSTLIGRLLYDAGQIYDDQLDALDDASKKFGTTGENRDFALLVDGLAAEREQGITIDVAYRYFRTKKRAFIVADTPGHEQYTRNMATGASSADVAIILIDARKGVLPQTRRHALIVSMLGVKKIALAINKMDLVNYDQAIFDKINRDFYALSNKLKFEEVRAIPISAPNGENVATSGANNMPWYNGPHLLQYLEEVNVTSHSKAPFRFPVQWVNRPDLNFRGFSGFVSSGSVKIGDTIRVSSSGETAKVAKIVTYDGEIETAIEGQAPTICLDKEIDVSRGDVLTLSLDHLRPKNHFRANVFWMSNSPSLYNKEYIFQQATSKSFAKIAVQSQTNLQSLQQEAATSLKMNAIGGVEITISKAILLDTYKNDKELGAFILVDKITNETVALGMIESVLEKVKAKDKFDELANKLLPYHANPVSALKYLLNWRIFAASIFSALAWLVTKDIRIFAFAFVAEFILRPLLQWAHYNLYYLDAKSSNSDDDNIDGSGI
jgi:bifunctional enzyme CysN/CysC